MANTKYTEREFYEMTIFALRKVGSELGVKSPTTMSKGDLVAACIAVQNGTVAPYIKGSKSKSTKKIEQTTTTPNQDQTPTTAPTDANVFDDNQPVKLNDSKPMSVSDSASEPVRLTAEELLASGECERRSGVLEILEDGYGFLRAVNCECSNKDAYVSSKIIKSLGLRKGDQVTAIARKNFDNKPAGVTMVELVNGMKPDNLRMRPNFDKMIPIYPNKRLKLELDGQKNDFAIRCVDLVAPIGKGQRAMIVSPPKAGKTTLLKKIATSISINHPEVELFVLLIDERPEEVTDMQRSIKGEVIYSTFDEEPIHHCKAAELLIEKAKRFVELGKDVVIIMDSLTRLARAYNLTVAPSGRTLSGGIDPSALYAPKKFFGSARNIEDGGSLTIIATALIDTGSRMDDVIYEEFKGTGNMEIHLDRKLSERRIFPAIDLNRSSTRREDLLLSPKELAGVYAMRRMLSGGENIEITENLFNMIVKTKNNADFVDQVLMQMQVIEKEGYSLRK